VHEPEIEPVDAQRLETRGDRLALAAGVAGRQFVVMKTSSRGAAFAQRRRLRARCRTSSLCR
jgi:hypothetical protein